MRPRYGARLPLSAAVAATTVVAFAGTATAAGQPGPKVNAQLERLAQQQNEKLPVDNGTMRVNRVSGGDGRYEYHITVVADRAGLSQAEWVAQWKRKVEGWSLAEKVCTSEQMAPFVQKGVTVAYHYSAPGGEPIADVEIKPDKCRGR